MLKTLNRAGLRAATSLFVFCLASHTFAQEQDGKNDGNAEGKPVELTEIIVRGTRDSSTDGDLRNSSVVTSDEVRAQNAGSVVDAVRQQPGVSIQQTTPGQGTIYVRGFSGRAVGHTVDGVRLNAAFYRAGNNPYLALVDPYSLERILIEQGATSVEYGSDALGGAVLMSTPSPGFAVPGYTATTYKKAVPTVQLYQSVSSNPWGQRSHAELTHRLKKTSINFGFTYLRDTDIRPGRGLSSPDPDSYVGLERAVGEAYQPEQQRAQEGTAYEFFGANMTVRHALKKWLLTAKAQAGVRPTLVRYDRIVPLFKNEYPARFQAESSPMSRGMVSVSARHAASRPIYKWSELMLAWQGLSETNFERKLDEVCLDEPAVSDGETCVSHQQLVPAASTSKEHNRSDAGSLRFITGLSLSETTNLRLGIDAHVDRITSQAWDTDLLTNETGSATTRFPHGSTMSEGGLFAKAGFDGQRLHGYVGARLMGFYLALPESEGHTGLKQGLVDFSASAGLRYDLADELAIMANLARGVRAPNVADFSGVGARAQGRYQLPSADIAPEHSYTADLGVKWQSPWLNLKSFVFGSRYADAIILAPTSLDGEEYSPEGDRYYHSVNAARIDYLGLDLSFEATLITDYILFGRYLAMMGVETNPEDSGLPLTTPADRVPPYQGELGIDIAPISNFEFRFWSRFRAKQQRLNDPVNLEDNRIPEGGTPGYITLHARAAYRVTKQLETFILLDNLTNARVLDHGSGFYGAGFSGTAGLSLDTSL